MSNSTDQVSDIKTRPRRVLPQVPPGRSARPVSAPAARRLRSVGGETGAGNAIDVSHMSQASVLEAGSRLSTSPPGMGKRDFVSPVKFSLLVDGEDSSVTVAVRVRPFSEREKHLGAKQVVRMHGNETIITSKDGVVHRFYYDHCFWSFDSTHTEHAGQEKVYKELAQPLLDRSFEGYNTCLFAYGQTGSGKSYCIMGEGEDQGVVPQFARELYNRTEGTTDEQTTYKVQVSYYEIYNEKIYDLLASVRLKAKTKLRVREHPVMGPYVEDLSTYVATSYADIEHWINLGNRFRATAATGMNDRSSRSHSVFTIMLTQTSVLEGEEHTKVSRINLIDLAGSERSSVSQTTGQRLREGASINRSLHTLGKVISLLSEKSTGKRRKVYIPYRDSTLTWLLKESLGGNSKTAMIATISPADLHYDQSLSTLRYAQQARTIINVARINEDPNARIIRELRQEIEYLRSLMGQGMDTTSGIAEIQELRDKLKESEKLILEASRSWQEKLAETEARKREEVEQMKSAGVLKVDNRLPNLVNLNEDPQLSEMLLYVLKEGTTSLGRGGLTSTHDVELTGALVTKNHWYVAACINSFVNSRDGSVVLEPSENSDAQTFVNGSLITESTTLHHGDRVVVGGEHFFRFNHPLEVERGASSQGQGGFEYAKNELIRVQTARLEAELEEKRLREQKQLMHEIQSMKEAAQEELDQQKNEYESRLLELETQMKEQTLEVSVHQRTKEEAESKMEELQRRNQLLEEETMTQKHLIHLEKLKTEQEYAEVKEQKSRLMVELEQEKMKLQEDIVKLNKNKQLRQQLPSIESGGSSMSDTNLLRGSELVKMAMMLQEATAICKTLNKPLTFSREEESYERGESEVRVRVNNTQQGTVTYWDRAKFETRLEQMKDVYQSVTATGSVTSLEGGESVSSGTSEEADPFHDPTDTWIRDSLLTPHTSPYRTAQLRRSILSSAGSPGGRRGVELTPIRSLMAESMLSRGASPALDGGTPNIDLVRRTSYYQLSQSLPRVCHEHIGKILSFKEDAGYLVSIYQRLLSHVWEVRAASQALEEAFDKHTPTPDLNVPFSEMTEVRLHTVSLHTHLQLLVEVAKAMREQCWVLEGMQGAVGEGRMRGNLEQCCVQLLSTVCHQTALYCSRLLQGVDNGVEETIRESCQHLYESLDSVTCLVGQLSLGRKVLERKLCARGTPDSPDDFLSVQPYQRFAMGFYQGYCEWCTLSIENTSHTIQDDLTAFGNQTSLTTPQPFVTELVDGICRVMGTALSFLQKLAEMQAAIWNLESMTQEEGTLPLTSNTHHVLEMLTHLQHIQENMHGIQEQAEVIQEGNCNLEELTVCNGHVTRCCNELAASVLTVIKSSSCTAGQELSIEVQSLSREIARAGKALTHLIKQGKVSTKSSKTSGKRTSLAMKQVTHSNSNSPPNVTADVDDVI